MTEHELIEAMRDAVRDMDESTAEGYARAALAAIRAAGFAVVPVKPTADMLVAMAGTWSVDWTPYEQERLEYANMLDASPLAPKP